MTLQNSIKSACIKPIKISLPTNYKFYSPTTTNFNSNSYRLFTINLISEDFYSTSKYFLSYNNQKLTIYKHTLCLNFKLIKVIKNHLIIFYKNRFKKSVINFLFKLIINILDLNIKRVEAYLTGIILYLDIDRCINIKEYKNGFKIIYKDFTFKYFNCYMEVDNDNNDNKMEKVDNLSQLECNISRSNCRVSSFCDDECQCDGDLNSIGSRIYNGGGNIECNIKSSINMDTDSRNTECNIKSNLNVDTGSIITQSDAGSNLNIDTDGRINESNKTSEDRRINRGLDGKSEINIDKSRDGESLSEDKGQATYKTFNSGSTTSLKSTSDTNTSTNTSNINNTSTNTSTSTFTNTSNINNTSSNTSNINNTSTTTNTSNTSKNKSIKNIEQIINSLNINCNTHLHKKNKLKPNSIIKTLTTIIYIKKNEIYVFKDDYMKIIECKGIKKVVGYDKFLFVQGVDCFKVFYFCDK